METFLIIALGLFLMAMIVAFVTLKVDYRDLEKCYKHDLDIIAKLRAELKELKEPRLLDGSKLVAVHLPGYKQPMFVLSKSRIILEQSEQPAYTLLNADGKVELNGTFGYFPSYGFTSRELTEEEATTFFKELKKASGLPANKSRSYVINHIKNICK